MHLTFARKQSLNFLFQYHALQQPDAHLQVGLSRCATGGEEDSLPGVVTKVKVHLTGQIL